MRPSSHFDIARRASRDLPDGSYVNLGVGIPNLVAGLLERSREIMLHSENGILGLGPPPPPGQEDPEVCDAGKNPITLLPGASIFSHSESFLIVRGGHLDLALLGAFQVSARGDLANWKTVGNGRPPAVGGAMDLAVGARGVWALMEHVQKDGTPRILERCSYPLTAAGVVDRIYTDLCTLDVTPAGLLVRERVESMDLADLQARTQAPLRLADDCRSFAEAARG
jgi:3-oxoadipate CoA-transferase, beta subunit